MPASPGTIFPMTTAKTPKSTKKAYESPRVQVSGKVGDLTLQNTYHTLVDQTIQAGHPAIGS